MKIEEIEKILDLLIPNPKCELQYNKDYEFLIATVLSAQSTDKSVNKVTKVLFKEYKDLNMLKNAELIHIKDIIKTIGTYEKKSIFVKEIATILVDECNSKVPKSRKKLESMPGVGRKTANLVLNNIYNIPTFAVDTHVSRVAKRLGLSKSNDSVVEIEKKLKRKFKKEEWGKRHHQLVLFGRYYCKAKKPQCLECKLKKYCKKEKEES